MDQDNNKKLLYIKVSNNYIIVLKRIKKLKELDIQKIAIKEDYIKLVIRVKDIIKEERYKKGIYNNIIK